jgi:hypothetical protein
MSGENQEIYNKIKEAEEKIEHLERNVSVIICTAMPIALAFYTAMF